MNVLVSSGQTKSLNLELAGPLDKRAIPPTSSETNCTLSYESNPIHPHQCHSKSGNEDIPRRPIRNDPHLRNPKHRDPAQDARKQRERRALGSRSAHAAQRARPERARKSEQPRIAALRRARIALRGRLRRDDDTYFLLARGGRVEEVPFCHSVEKRYINLIGEHRYKPSLTVRIRNAATNDPVRSIECLVDGCEYKLRNVVYRVTEVAYGLQYVFERVRETRFKTLLRKSSFGLLD
ncbi:hypothetical protein BC830DRAFT_1136801 [Chytriomyces sp. MP71]|nr:hypothetical protein BC830DRAFT_1136801 [Chytriomyces sp. MP71]